MFYPPTLMKKPISLFVTLTFTFAAFFHPVASAAKTPKTGAPCTKLKATQIYKGKKYTCIKSGKKLVWNKGVVVKVTPTPSQTASATPEAPTPSPTPTRTPTPTPSATKVGYTIDQVKANNSDRSCWSVIDGNVYDLTRWINSHPGGPGVIRAMCGVDGTRSFLNQHEGRREPIQRLSMYLLGPLSK